VIKAVSIFFLGIYMLTFAEFHHLLRIPVLVEHFKEHRLLDPSITFLMFIRLHYVGEIVADGDYQRDNQLPFREADRCITSMTLSCECPGGVIEITSPPTEITSHFKLYDEDNNSRLSVADIFQPPRPA
jgi:hypothetical protein